VKFREVAKMEHANNTSRPRLVMLRAIDSEKIINTLAAPPKGCTRSTSRANLLRAAVEEIQFGKNSVTCLYASLLARALLDDDAELRLACNKLVAGAATNS
jgi:hypothetical protein